MVGRFALVTLLVTGCNQIFGLGKAREIDADLAPDLDKDGIQDDVDPCVAAAIDATGDLNSNGIPNADDPCPTLTAPSPDTDGDGFPDNCDPFPLLPGDRRSCFMHFSNPDLNQTLWQSRSGQPSWTVAQAGKVSASISSITAIVATEPLLEPSTVTTYKATGLIFGLQGDPQDRTVGIWLRAGVDPDASDLGCAIRGGSQGSNIVAISGDGELMMPLPPLPASATFFLWGTVDRSAGRIICRGRLGAVDVMVEKSVAIPDGHVGMFASDTDVAVDSLSIFGRDP